jgi:predicted branched-subunit amino acid permease
VFLVLISQVSWHLLAQAVLFYNPKASESLLGTQNASALLAYSAGGLGFMFSGAVLVITRGRLDSELRVYKVTGLPMRSALRLILVSHPVVPLAWAVIAGAVAGLVDVSLGLDAALPVGLAVAFAALLLGWLVFVTFQRFSRRGLEPGRKGRVG